MKQNFLQQIVLYRYRYIIAYSVYLIILVGLLTFQLTTIPSGLSPAEINSAVASSKLQLSVDTRMVDLPYHALQKLSIELIGLNALGIKLPSVIFGILSGIGFLLLLLRWFKRNVALIASLLAVSSSMFLIAGRTGTPDIMIIFWAIYLLLLATFITQEAKGHYVAKILMGLFIGLSLYTPLSLYVLGAALIAGLLHPHARYTIVRYGGPQMAGAAALFVLAIIPLGIGLWHTPENIYEFTGFTEGLPSSEEYLRSLISVGIYIAGFTMPRIGETIQPAFTIAILVLIGLGVLRALTDSYATRTYMLLLLTVVLVPVIALRSEYMTGLYVPAMLFMAIGIEALIREWYSLFPLNPYARLTGLLPLVALIGGVWYYNYSTYFIGYRYSPESAQVFNNDLNLLNKYLAKTSAEDKNPITIVVPGKDKDFYSILDTKHDSVTTSGVIPPDSNKIVVAKEAYSSDMGMPHSFLVNDTQTNSLRWYIIKR